MNGLCGSGLCSVEIVHEPHFMAAPLLFAFRGVGGRGVRVKMEPQAWSSKSTMCIQ